MTFKNPRPISLEEAKGLYIHRFTCEHVPAWAMAQSFHNRYPAPQYATDQEWYDNTAFKGEHAMATATHCYSLNMTWPLGRTLDEPFHLMKGRNATACT